MYRFLDPDLAAKLLAPPSAKDNKYTRGCVGFITGSTEYPGAALLGINAAFELGIGMVRYLGDPSVTNLVVSSRPEVVPGLAKAQSLVVGSGVPEALESKQAKSILAANDLGLPMIIDAGALQIVDFEKLSSSFLITPHVGEAAKLFERFSIKLSRSEIEAEPIQAAQQLAKLTGGVVLLKGHVSHIAYSDKEPVASGPGSAHLATAGTGDVLAGMLGALTAKLVALGIEPDPEHLIDLAIMANNLLSEAAEIAASQGRFGASMISDAISEAARA